MDTTFDSVIQGLLARFTEFGEEFHAIGPKIEALQADIKRLEERKTELGEQGEALVKAAKVFNFDLVAAYKAKTGRLGEVPAAAPETAVPKQARRPSIKKFVLNAAKAAYPKPVRASLVRADLAKQGEEVHEKTVGMTLYRLLKKGLLRREGFDWYFVPQDEQAAQEEGADA